METEMTVCIMPAPKDHLSVESGSLVVNEDNIKTIRNAKGSTVAPLPTYPLTTYMSGTKTEAFRPQGRLPLDPFRSSSPSRAAAKIENWTGKEKAREKSSWTVKEEDIQGVWKKQKFEQGRVILVLGAPAAKDLGPLLSSRILSNSLVILATEQPPANLGLLVPEPPSEGPALVVLRLQILERQIPQYLHSVLTRAELIAHRWREDPKSVFADTVVDRGRAMLRRQRKEETEIRAVQFSELDGVFGRDFVVKEAVGYVPNIASASKTQSSRTRAPLFTSMPKLSKNVHSHRVFDALINFVSASVVDEEGLLHSITSVSTTSRSFLSLPESSLGGRRGRSASRGHRGRSSSLDRIRDWISRSRSRSKARDSPKSGPSRTERVDIGKGKEKAAGQDESQDVHGTGMATRSGTLESNDNSYESKPKKAERSRSIMLESKGSQNQRTAEDYSQLTRGRKATDSATKKAEHGVLTSRSRAKLDQANRVGRAEDSALGGAKESDHEGFKAYIINVLPLPPPSRSGALLHTNFTPGPSRDSTLRSQGSGSGSSSEAEIPPLGINHNIMGNEIKQGAVPHSVPTARKPESVKSSQAVALNSKHKPSGSIGSIAHSDSAGSIPSLRVSATLLSANETKKESAPSSDGSGGEQAEPPVSLSPQPLPRRPASVLSAAVEAAVESAYSFHANRRVLPPRAPRTNFLLQRQSAAMQVASAAAVAALEVHLAKTSESTEKVAPELDSGSKLQLYGVNGKTRHSGADQDEVIHSRQLRLSTDIPDALLPYPHRQSTLALHDSIFAPLNFDGLLDGISPAGNEDAEGITTVVSPPTPISLLPRPHERARTISLDGGIQFSRKPGPTPMIANAALPRKTSFTPSFSTIPSSDPEFYFERTSMIQEMENFLLSYSYADSQCSISALPDPQAQKSPAPASFILPQGLLDLVLKTSVDSSKMSIIDLIIHGLLDPSSDSLKLYRNAVARAPKTSSSANGRGVTLDELMALSVLSGEENGVLHSMPKAWIGGIADIDVQGAITETFTVPSVPEVKNDGTTKDSSASESASNLPPLLPPLLALDPSVPAVSLHSQTVALSPEATSASPDSTRFKSSSTDQLPLVNPFPPSSQKLTLDFGSEKEQGDDWKQLVKEFILPVEEVDDISAAHIPATPATDKFSFLQKSPAPLLRTATAPELSSLVIPNAISGPRTSYSFVPPGAALPADPHLPSVYSSFPRHSVMFKKPLGLNLPPSPENEKTAELELDEHDYGERSSAKEVAGITKEPGGPEDIADIGDTSNTSPAFSPLQERSPSLAGTDDIFDEEIDPSSTPQEEIEVTVTTVSLSDASDSESSVLMESPSPSNTLLLENVSPTGSKSGLPGEEGRQAQSIMVPDADDDSELPTPIGPPERTHVLESTLSSGIRRRSTLPTERSPAGVEGEPSDKRLSRSGSTSNISAVIEPDKPTPTRETMDTSIPFLADPVPATTLASMTLSPPLSILSLPILSLPLNNFSTFPQSPPEGRSSFSSEESSLSSSSSASTPTRPLPAPSSLVHASPASMSLSLPSPSSVVNENGRPSPSSSHGHQHDYLPRRHSSNNGVLLSPPIGPRAPKRGRSLRETPFSDPSGMDSIRQIMSPAPRRPLPRPMSILDEVEVKQTGTPKALGLGVGSRNGDKDEEATVEEEEEQEETKNLKTKNEQKEMEAEEEETRTIESDMLVPRPFSLTPPLPGAGSGSSSRPSSRSTTPIIAPLRKLAIDEIPPNSSTSRTPRISAVSVGTCSHSAGGSVGEGDSSPTDIVGHEKSGKSKWKFWSSNNRPVTMMVDLTREI